MSRRALAVVAVAVAVLVGGGLALALAVTSGEAKHETSTGPAAVSEVAAMLRGIPQQGIALGSPRAPVTLVEFADPQCPYCGEWARTAFPEIVRRYVRTGKVRVVFNGMAFVGPDSATALRTALAAGRQGRFWNVLELLFQNQGVENTGWVTEPLLRSIGDAVPGLDTQTMLDERDSPAVDRSISEAQALAYQAGVNATPAFAVGRTGQTLHAVRLESLDASGLEPSLDAALKS